MSLIKDYFNKTIDYKSQYGDKTIVFIQCGSFFEVYALKNNEEHVGSNIDDFSRICDLNIVEKKAIVDNLQVVMAGFKEPYWEKYTRKMQEYGYSVVIFTQDQACANTTRSLYGIFSPGSFFDEIKEDVSNFTCCIWLENVNASKLNPFSLYIGVSFVDIITGHSYIYEFKENYIHSPSTFDQLEKVISSFTPSETIIISPFAEETTKDIINFVHLNSKLIHTIYLNNLNENHKNKIKNCYKQKYQSLVLTKYFKVNDFDVFIQDFIENPIATQSYCYLLDFLFLHNSYLVNNLLPPQFYNSQDRLLLGNHSLKQLNIINDSNKNGKLSSIINLLNDCKTNMGKREFKFDFLNPITNSKILNNEYNIIESMQHFRFHKDITNKLVKIKDISKFRRKIVMRKITPKDIYNLSTSLNKVLEIISIINPDESIRDYLTNKLNDFVNLENKIEGILNVIDKNIDLDLCKNIDSFIKFDINFIKSEIYEKLDEEMSLLKQKEKELSVVKDFLNELVCKNENKKKESDFIKIHETEKNNINFIITEKRSKMLENQLKSLNKSSCDITYQFNSVEKIISIESDISNFSFPRQSSTNKFIYSNQITTLCKDIFNLKHKVIDSINIAFSNFIQNIQLYDSQLFQIEQFIVTIDILICKYALVQKYNLTKPELIDSKNSFLNIRGLRHLLIEELSTNEIYVPNDICLGNEETNGILLYGTNAVGKTSFIKSIGISIVMAQAGLFVPCHKFTFSPYKSLFTRLLGCDDLFKGLSTFAVEMTELRSILKYSDQNSLVLGDELCSGTESTSAKSIFVAGISNLYKKKTSFIFATHLHEISNYEEINELNKLKLKHMKVKFNKQQNRLEYDRKIYDGPGETIYGLEVCKSLDMPVDFLEEANNLRIKYSPLSQSFLEMKSSRYNAKKIKGGVCELCNLNKSSEIHHLKPQKDFNTDNANSIKNNNNNNKKNHCANLINICEDCHINLHKQNKILVKIKTSNGYDLEEN
jgi:DNA mismatch repair protein MutS